MRFGILGAAPFARRTLIEPAKACPDVQVHAVAARDRARAGAFAAKHGIPHVAGDYRALLADDEIDAVYLPLPDDRHPEWVRAALEAGKHVLCERPLATGEDTVRELAKFAADNGLVLTENLPQRYHPLVRAARTVLDSGELGAVRKIVLSAGVPGERRGPVVHGLGYEAVDLLRVLARAETEGEPEPLSARGGNRSMHARLRLAGGGRAVLRAANWRLALPRPVTHVYATEGELRLINPFAPHLGHQLAVLLGDTRTVRHFPRRTAYSYQLDAFARAANTAEPEALVALSETAATVRIVDALYRSVGGKE